MNRYNVRPTANRKYVRELLRQLPKGFKIGMIEVASDGTRPNRLVNSNHPCVLRPDGQLLLSDNGHPVHVSNTPGTKRSMKNDLAEIKRAIT